MAELLAFTAEHVCRLTGLSGRQLRYWDATDFFSPTLVGDQPRRVFHRIYTFRDVVGLRVIGVLRNQRRIPLQELRRVGEWLRAHFDTPWSSLRFALAGRRIIFADPTTGAFVEAYGSAQVVVPVALEPIANEMSQAAERLTQRQASEIGRIVRNRYVVHNAWVVAGTRIPTDAIWNYHQAGFDADSIIEEYPRLTEEDIKAVVEFEKGRRKAA